MGRKKKFVVEIYEKYVDQKKHQSIRQKFLRRNIKKKLSTLIAKKKECFLSEVKKKFASNKNSTEKIKMRKEITRLEQKLEKANQNRPNKNEKKVTFKENEIDDNDNAWETVGATKSKNSIKTRTAVNTCAKATPTKGQKVIENKNRKKQTRQKSTVKKSTKIDKRQPNKKDLDNQNVKNNEKNNRLSSSTECSSTTSNGNNSDLTQTINDLSDKDDNANVTRQIPFVKSKKEKCIIGDSNMRGLAKQLNQNLTTQMPYVYIKHLE